MLHRASTLCLGKGKVLPAFPCLEFDGAKVKCLHYLKSIHFSSVSSASVNSQALICKSPGKHAVEGFQTYKIQAIFCNGSLKTIRLSEKGDCTILNRCG